MKFDTIIIGGGLAGLVCGLKLQTKGQRCAIISAGQNAMHFSSGYFDLLDRTPDGKDVSRPEEAFPSLGENHPYSKIGTDRMVQYMNETPVFFSGYGIRLNGNPMENGYRISPTGDFRRTWMSLEEFRVLESPESLKAEKALIVNIEGFLDFNTGFIASSLEKKGIRCRTAVLELAEMERLRKNPSEMRSTNIARVMEKDGMMEKVSAGIRSLLKDEDLVILPAIFGFSTPCTEQAAERLTGKKTAFIATMPPSVPGIRVQMQLKSAFEKAGGVFLQGDSACSPEIEGNHVRSIGTVNFGDIRLSAENFVLATGSFFSKGLTATPERISETVFGLDLDAASERKDWYSLDFFGKQEYMSFGVRTDNNFRCIKDGMVIENLFAAGSILSGCNSLYEGCGAGVAIMSAFSVADSISGNGISR